jgi:Tfp pilus assembly protein PilO
MKNADRTILVAVPLVVLLAVFWFLFLSPKQDQVKQLDAKVTSAETAVATAQQTVSEGVGARKGFPRAYHRFVVSGKAVPTKDETASLLVQINRAAGASGIDFKTITSGGAGAGGTAATTTTATTIPTATPGGLTPVSYSLTFGGTFFQIADFIARLDRSVNPKGQRIASNARLITISGFTLTPDDSLPPPSLSASVTVSAYSADPSLGAAAGATTAAPTTTTPTTTTPATGTDTSGTDTASTPPVSP